MRQASLCLCVSLTFLLSVSPATAEPETLQRPLPSQFFSEDTFLVASVDVGRFSIERVYESVGLLIPGNLSAIVRERKGDVPGLVLAGSVLHEFAKNEAVRNQMIARAPNHPFVVADRTAKQLKELGIEQVLIVLTWRGGERQGFSTYVLAAADENLDQKDRDARQAGLQEIAESFGAKVESVPGWLVLHRETALPEDTFALSDATFAEALKSNRHHDIGVVFVATEKLRDQIASGIEALSKSAKGDEAHLVPLVKQIGKIVDSDWQYAGVDFGEKPAVRAAANFAQPAEAAEFGSSLTKLLAAVPQAAASDETEDEAALATLASFTRQLKVEVDAARLRLELDASALQQVCADAFKNIPPTRKPQPIGVNDGDKDE